MKSQSQRKTRGSEDSAFEGAEDRTWSSPLAVTRWDPNHPCRGWFSSFPTSVNKAMSRWFGGLFELF